MTTTAYRNSSFYRSAGYYRGTLDVSPQSSPGGGRAPRHRQRRGSDRDRRAEDEEKKRLLAVQAFKATAPVAPPPKPPVKPSAELIAALASQAAALAMRPEPPAERSVFTPAPGVEEAREVARAEAAALYTQERARIVVEQRQQREAWLAYLREEDQRLLEIIAQMEFV